ncbi:hypothetical protein BJX76DRAFT_323673 [Aspergillus varians]
MQKAWCLCVRAGDDSISLFFFRLDKILLRKSFLCFFFAFFFSRFLFRLSLGLTYDLYDE